MVEYKGKECEDNLFNGLNRDELIIGGVRVDINPITKGKTETLATYLPIVESCLEEKRAVVEQTEPITVWIEDNVSAEKFQNTVQDL